MKSNPENRDKTRFDHEAAVTLENKKIGLQRHARMFNYSNFGLYIETDHLLEPDTEIFIGIPNSPLAAEPDKYENYRSVIRWRKPLKHSAFDFGYGVEIISENKTQENDEDPYQGSRNHPRKNFSILVKYEYNNQSFEGITENVSSGGVFIKTRYPVAVGQTVTVYIPVKKKGKIKRFNGNVTWSTLKGFGVKFSRTP